MTRERIKQESDCLYTSTKWGIQEKDLVAMQMTKSMLSEKGISKEVRSEIVNTVVNLLNNCQQNFFGTYNHLKYRAEESL